jgi:exopolyphosphatase/guanosine-5'-triphosphate,3'-diphosphate pyrophosphatase
MQQKEKKLPRLAAIDIGTNSIRLVVVEVHKDGTYGVLDEERQMTRLGRGLYKSGKLSEESMARSLEALGRMKAIAEGFEVSELRAIATAAVREARNGRTFRRRVERQHGLRIKTISSRQEARLAFQSMTRQFNLNGRPVAMVDIGGGSVEIVFAAGSVIDRVYSLPLGAVRLTESRVKSDPLSNKHWKKLCKTIDRTIDRRIGKPPFKVRTIIGSGGTFSALASISINRKDGQIGSLQGYSISRAELDGILNQLRNTPLADRRQIPGLNPDRADISEGLLLSMIAERFARTAARGDVDDRMEWVRKFARKCRSNEPHCEHVAQLSLQIFDCVKKEFELPDEGRDILHAGALLHDIGYLIGHAKHHKHAYHLIMHGELPTFSAREQELIANVARYHRRALPKKGHKNLARLPKSDRRLVRDLSGILRVADGLDRAHTQSVTGVSCGMNDDYVHMLVAADAPPQVELWDANRKSGLFELAFHTKLELEWAGGAQNSN